MRKIQFLFFIFALVGCNNPAEPSKEVVTTGPGYKEYVALVTQSGTADPMAVVLKNEISDTTTWKRWGVGMYTLTINSGFPEEKTIVTVNPNVGGAQCNVTYMSTSMIQFATFNNGTLYDNFLDKASVIIRVYK